MALQLLWRDETSMIADGDEGSDVQTALGALKPLESFSIQGPERTILVACMEVGAYAIASWCKEPELATNIEEVLQNRGILAYRLPKNERGRVSVACVVSDPLDASSIVTGIAAILNLSAKPGCTHPLITSSRIQLE